MDWGYATGYFDGEGSVGLYKSQGKAMRCHIAWFNTHLKSLEEIREFIGCGNIRGQARGRRKTQYGLYVARRQDLLRIIPDMLPHSIIKADRLREIYSWMKTEVKDRADFWGSLSVAGVETIGRLYWEDKMTQGRIAKKYGVTPSAVRLFMQRHNIPRRTMKQALAIADRDTDSWRGRSEKIRQQRLANWRDPEYRQRQSESMRGKKK